jgi:hypothetical protein
MLGVVGFARVEGDTSDIFVVTLDAALAELLPVRDRAPDTATIVQVAPGFAVRAGAMISLGVRAAVALLLVTDSSSEFGFGGVAQVSLEPFIRTNLGRGFASVRFIYNVDDEYGPSFDRYGVWGAGLGAGIAF